MHSKFFQTLLAGCLAVLLAIAGVGAAHADAGPQAPDSPDLYFSTPYQTAVSGNLCVDATDPQHEPVTVASAKATGGGTLTYNSATCAFTWTPPAGMSVQFPGEFTLTDGTNVSATIHYYVKVGAPGNAPPVLASHEYSTGKGAKFLFADRDAMLMEGASDPEGQPLSMVFDSGPVGGWLPGEDVVSSPNYGPNAYEYIPPTGFTGIRRFEYAVTDGVNVSYNLWSMTITDLAQSAPVANPDGYVVPHDVGITVDAAHGVLANDTDADSAYFAVGWRTPPSHGTLTMDNTTGAFTYKPAIGYIGPDSFSYGVRDSELNESSTVTVTLSVENIAPTAKNDAYEVGQDASLHSATSIFANDTDPDSTFQATSHTQPAHGTLTLDDATGQFDYTPTPGWSGTDAWTYALKDADGATGNTATVTITVVPKGLNQAPIAAADSYLVHEGEVLTVKTPGVLGNDTDFEHDAMVATVIGTTTHGILKFAADGSFVYTPAAGWRGDDSFTYRASDPSAAKSDLTTVTIHVVNDPPTAIAHAYTARPGVDLVVPGTSGLAAGAKDAEGDAITMAGVSFPLHGTVSKVDPATGAFTYRAAAGFTGTDTFTYMVMDSLAQKSAPATVTITVKYGTFTAPTPTISGTHRVGRVQTANAGTWSPSATLTYQWRRNGVAISGATGSHYTATASDRGKSLTVAVTGKRTGYTTKTKVSSGVTIGYGVFTTVAPKITGTATVGHTLTASHGTWTPTPSTWKYQWLRNGHAITGATASTYKLHTADKGQLVSVKVTGVRTGYTTASRTSAGIRIH